MADEETDTGRGASTAREGGAAGSDGEDSISSAEDSEGEGAALDEEEVVEKMLGGVHDVASDRSIVSILRLLSGIVPSCEFVQ